MVTGVLVVVVGRWLIEMSKCMLISAKKCVYIYNI